MTAAHDRSDTTGRTARSPSEIEDDIRAIRSRMDHTLDEIEYRLSPGQLSGGVVELVRDVVQGNPNRTARAIRDNPIPVALIGIGVLWLAWAVSRTPSIEGRRMAGHSHLVSDQRIRILLTGLAGAARQGAEGVRQADLSLADTGLSPRLREIAAHMDRSAAALDEELHRMGGSPDPHGPLHPAWRDLHQAAARNAGRADILAALQHGMDGTMALFRDALHEPLPEEARVVVGSHFHEMETVQHHVSALREAVG